MGVEAAVVVGSGAAVVVAGTGSTIAVVTGVGSDVGVLAGVVVGSGVTVVAVWMNAPPGTEVEGSGSALVVGAGAAASEVVVAAGAAALEPEEPDDPEVKESEVVRSPTVADWQELGPDAQPMRRLATSEA
jgi:hypothetical protein